MNPLEIFNLFVRQQFWRAAHYRVETNKPEIPYATMRRLLRQLSEDEFTTFTEYLMDEGIISKFDSAVYLISTHYIKSLPEPNHFDLQRKLL